LRTLEKFMFELSTQEREKLRVKAKKLGLSSGRLLRLMIQGL